MKTFKYRICWRAKYTTAEGNGEKLFDSFGQAKQIAEEPNHSESGKWCFHVVEAVEVADDSEGRP